MVTTVEPNPHTPDMLYGVPSISQFLGLKRRQAQYLIEKGRLPIFRPGDGKVICARRSTLTAWLAEQETAYASRRGGET